jgi:hypothetical protein
MIISFNNCQILVSFISDDAKGRVLQQAFSVSLKADNEGLPEQYNRLRSELILLHERIDYENQVKFGDFHPIMHLDLENGRIATPTRR